MTRAARSLHWLILGLLTMATACGGEGNAMDKVEAAFGSGPVAEMARAIADGDEGRIRVLAPRTDLRARGDRGVTLLEWAVLNRRPASLETLLELGADPAQPGLDGATVVHLAAMADDPQYLRILLARGADPDTPHAETRATPLAAALMGEREAQFEMLLDAGADPDAADRLGNTPLHVAAKLNEPGRALRLLQAGADRHARNGQGADFLRYLDMTPAGVRSAQARAEREALDLWLRQQDGAPAARQVH
ncbi:ankyrin repeat domain-containing protein [Coralloluteibacterium thermophilus]|uniref:Ankyrin repeat domain-containing protein n=1 Tax=Coralloluteibacterium thermophilum TaxID=2707049 RepID=A0ABV9NJ81_9GAMM